MKYKNQKLNKLIYFYYKRFLFKFKNYFLNIIIY